MDDTCTIRTGSMQYCRGCEHRLECLKMYVDRLKVEMRAVKKRRNEAIKEYHIIKNGGVS